MGNLRTSNSILSTLQASAADISVAGHKLAITSCPIIDYRKLESMGTGLLASVAEVLQVTTVTFTAANNTAFSINITQFVDSIGTYVNEVFTFNTDASSQTATDICNGFRAMINVNPKLQITASGTTTLILTAKSRSPIFRVTGAFPSNTVVSTGTAGVASRGTYADLVELGVTGAEVGATYSQVPFTYVNLSGSLLGNTESDQNLHTLYVKEGIANFAAFSTRIGEVFNAFAAGTTTSDPELISMG